MKFEIFGWCFYHFIRIARAEVQSKIPAVSREEKK
jgi:hypothetical protein